MSGNITTEVKRYVTICVLAAFTTASEYTSEVHIEARPWIQHSWAAAHLKE